MKKIFISVVMMLLFTTGCVTQEKTFNADYPVNGRGLIVKFSSDDEEKIEITTKFPSSDLQLAAEVTTYTDMFDQKLRGCTCIGRQSCVTSWGLVCQKRTVKKYSNVGCYSQPAFNNSFNNTEQNFYARRLHTWFYSDDVLDPHPICVSGNGRMNVVEYIKADFNKNKSGKVLTYEIRPTKRNVDSKWSNFLFLEKDITPTNEKELASANRIYRYALDNPINVDALFAGAVSVEYDPMIRSFNAKYEPASMMTMVKSNGKNKYKMDFNDEGNGCYGITFRNDGLNSNYAYSVDVSLCRINNTQSKVTIGKANITIKNAGEVDLTKFGSVINQIAGFFK